MNGEPAQFARGRIMLTVAHLDHTPQNCDEGNLKAMCQRCHLRYDRDHHIRNASATRAARKAATFVGSLLDDHRTEEGGQHE